MIFSYSELVKNKAKKYNLNYDKLYKNGLNTIKLLVKEYADTINETFIDQILNHDDIYFILYSNNVQFLIKNCIGVIIYTKTNDKIYLLLICIDKKYRKYGYGKLFLNEFIEYIKLKHTKNKKMILHSIDKSIEFYKTFGFLEVENSPRKYRKLFKYEKYNKYANLLALDI
jgi:ribosomal protein S18 acetylase RimI-like enzyme